MDHVLLSTQALAIGYPSLRGAGRILFRDLNLQLRAGELICLLGPNGVGKSTLLRTLVGLRPAVAGTVLIHGRPLGSLSPIELARSVAVVLTERIESPSLTAQELVSLGRHPYTGWSGRLRPEDREAVRFAMEHARVLDLADRLIGELSDGERQRVLIARAIAQEALAIVLDEPTAFLDLPRRVEIATWLRQYAREKGRAVLLSTHDLDLALRAADRLWLLGTDGRLFDGSPEDLVLDGTFGRVFAAEGVAFDERVGAFRFTHPTRGRIQLIGGSTIDRFWTAHALERSGFTIDDDLALPLKVEINSGDSRSWRWSQGEVVGEASCIAELLDGVVCRVHVELVEQQEKTSG